jgi:hypothetical protein
MSASQPERVSTVEHLEEDAVVAGYAAAGALRGVEIAAIVLLGLLVCPPLAILVAVVVLPLLAIGLVVALLGAVLAVPYLLVHHFRNPHGGHVALFRHRVRHAGRALVDLAPHRIVNEARRAAR